MLFTALFTDDEFFEDCSAAWFEYSLAKIGIYSLREISVLDGKRVMDAVDNTPRKCMHLMYFLEDQGVDITTLEDYIGSNF